MMRGDFINSLLPHLIPPSHSSHACLRLISHSFYIYLIDNSKVREKTTDTI